MKNKLHFIIGMVFVAIITLTGCEETQGSATLRLRLTEDSGARATSREVISPPGQSLLISGYTVSGTGPNDNTFSVSTNSTQVDINGLVIGTWEINVTGFNQQGTAMARGTASHHLTSSDNTVEVVLNEFIGEGSVNIGFDWVDPAYPNIALDLKLKAQGGVEETITDGKTLFPASASARYEAVLPTGSYDLAFILYSNGTRIAGGVVALRILDGHTSEQEITILVDQETPEATGLQISTDVVDPVSGTILGLPATILPNTSVTATFSRGGGGGPGAVSVDWYLDGSHMASGNSIEFSTYTGPHRLDAIAKTGNLGSVGSETLPFRASVKSQQRIPVIVSSVNEGELDAQQQPYWLTGVTDTAFLRDGRLLVASADGLQLCEIRKDRLVVVKNFTSTGAATSPQTDPYPTNGISDITIDTVDNIICTTARGLGTVVLYNYDASAKELHKIVALDTSSSLWDGAIGNVALNTSLKTLYVVDPVANILHFTTYGTEGLGSFKWFGLFSSEIQVVDPQQVTVSSDGTRLGLACPTNRTFHTYKLSIDPITGNPKVFEELHTTVAAGLASGPYDIRIVGNLLQLSLEDGLQLYRFPDTGSEWIQEQKISIDTSRVIDLAFDSTFENCWILHGGPQPKVAKSTLFNGVPVYDDGSMDTGSFAASGISYSPKGNFLSLYGDNRLMLLRISDG